jgi:hypothetical protein
MSVIFSDPRNNPKFFTYFATDTKGEYTYNNPDITLQTIQKAFNVLLADINGFNNSTSVQDLDKYSLNILNDLQGIVTAIESCASNQTPTKCDTTICKYVGEIQLVYTFFQIVLTDITRPDSKQNYDFLAFYAQNYLVKPITDNPSNIIPAGDPKNPQYSLCYTSRYQPPSNDPKMKAVYDALIARQNAKLQTVQNNNTLYNLMLGAVVLLAVVIIIYIVKIMFFNGSTTTKKIGGMLRPGPPSYVRLV